MVLRKDLYCTLEPGWDLEIYNYSMQSYNNKLPLFSIHMPKTGGTSFRNVLYHWFGTGLRFHYYDERNNKPPVNHGKLFRRSWKSFIKKRTEFCIHGHFNTSRSIGVLDYYPNAKQCITILRDPLEVAVSNFFYVKKMESEGASFRSGKEFKIDMDIDEFIENNISFIPHYLPIQVNEKNIEEIVNRYFIHIGVLENYQRSIDILAEILHKSSIKVPHENAAPRDYYPSECAIKKFRENNGRAYRLYDYAVELNK